jgi:hypothetical protein
MKEAIMKRAVITPSYIKHFPCIKLYLTSAEKYLEDKDFPFWFVVSRDEKAEFDRLLDPFRGFLNLNVLTLEDIFARFGVAETPTEALEKYGRFSFQTLKKMYAALYVNADQFLILDSESMFIKPTHLNNTFNEYFTRPSMFMTHVSDFGNEYKNDFTWNLVVGVNGILGSKPEYWPIDSYSWFWERRILDDLLRQYGQPIDIVRKCYPTGKFPDLEGVPEALIYYQFIANNNKYGYTIAVMNDVLPQYIGAEAYDELLCFHGRTFFRVGGLFECFAQNLNKRNVEGFIRLINDYNLPIVRLETSFHSSNWRQQRQLVEHTRVRILASSQRHGFGLNSPTKARIEIPWNKTKKHLNNFFRPLKHFVIWLTEPFSVMFYVVKTLLALIRD